MVALFFYRQLNRCIVAASNPVIPTVCGFLATVATVFSINFFRSTYLEKVFCNFTVATVATVYFMYFKTLKTPKKRKI